MTQAYSGKKFECFYQESNLRPSDYLSLDALPLSYRRLVGAKAIKLGSWDNSLHAARIGMSYVAYVQWNKSDGIF